MFVEVSSLAELDLLRMIDPRHVEYPCACERCGATLSVYRAQDTPYGDVADAAAAIHRDESPQCAALEMRVREPYPLGPHNGEVQ